MRAICLCTYVDGYTYLHGVNCRQAPLHYTAFNVMWYVVVMNVFCTYLLCVVRIISSFSCEVFCVVWPPVQYVACNVCHVMWNMLFTYESYIGACNSAIAVCFMCNVCSVALV